ncbi:MAG: alpha/beta fold hydrolase [Akkermansiaceae bacterium]|jgi:2-succinyl-6-hydroxy-2,4-cyclohexadiene-1-carboxylate synthase|nr:alpha/beta fold hydrolase [Akkermansiaceae bacterium]
MHQSKIADERREAGSIECWCLHGAVGMAADFRSFAKQLALRKTGTRAVDLWRFLECQSMPLASFAQSLNAEAAGEVSRGHGKALLGYSMGGRLALHALLELGHPWNAGVIISAHPGLEPAAERQARRASDTTWATRALTGNWQEFLTAWNAQPLLGGAMRDPQASSSLVMRRREIARSYVDWSLGAQEPLWDRLAEITIPVLWVVGENDAKFLDLAHKAVSQIPKATLAIAPHAGHRVPWEAEEWLAEEVSRFLSLGR